MSLKDTHTFIKPSLKTKVVNTKFRIALTPLGGKKAAVEGGPRHVPCVSCSGGVV